MTKNQMMRFLSETYKLKTLIRYNNTPRIGNESIAEHMYFCALIVYKLYDEFKFDLHIAIRMALFHDIPEIYLSDMPHNTKSAFPEIASAVKNSQKAASDMLDPTMTPLIEDYENQGTIEAKIVRLADLLSILQYTGQESKLGNQYMTKIFKEMKPLVDKQFKMLEGCKR